MTTLTESPDCDCRIELTRVISLSDSLHPGLFAYSPLVMRDSRGVWYATSNTDGLKQVGVFDPDGRLRKVIGRLGEGPGEFTHVNHIVVGSGDTLYVYDHSQLRRSVFDPGHEFVRTERIPAYMRDMVPLPSGRMIVNSTIRTADGVHWPLHLVGADGGVLQTFGNETASSRPDDSFLELRAIAVDGDGMLWVAPRNAYELATYSMAGMRLEPTNRRYGRQADWFPPWTESSRGTEPPRPNVKQIAFGSEDPTLLWVLIIRRRRRVGAGPATEGDKGIGRFAVRQHSGGDRPEERLGSGVPALWNDVVAADPSGTDPRTQDRRREQGLDGRLHTHTPEAVAPPRPGKPSPMPSNK